MGFILPGYPGEPIREEIAGQRVVIEYDPPTAAWHWRVLTLGLEGGGQLTPEGAREAIKIAIRNRLAAQAEEAREEATEE